MLAPLERQCRLLLLPSCSSPLAVHSSPDVVPWRASRVVARAPPLSAPAPASVRGRRREVVRRRAGLAVGGASGRRVAVVGWLRAARLAERRLAGSAAAGGAGALHLAAGTCGSPLSFLSMLLHAASMGTSFGSSEADPAMFSLVVS